MSELNEKTGDVTNGEAINETLYADEKNNTDFAHSGGKYLEPESAVDHGEYVPATDEDLGLYIDTYENNDDVEVIKNIMDMPDDVTIPALTIRSTVIGIILGCFGAAITQLYYFKPIGVAIPDVFLQVIAYCLGKAWEKTLPRLGGWLNPGKFTIKEHAIATIFASAANTQAYGTYTLGAQELYYANPPGPAGGIFMLLATQLVGYGIAGNYRRFLVYPSHMTWPYNYPKISLMTSLHADIGSRRRMKWFFIVFAIVFIYEFIPQYLFPLLSAFSIFCLANPNSELFTNIFGGIYPNEGLGILSLSFDWNYVATFNALIYPFWSQLNMIFGVLLVYIIIPLAYYNNVWYAQNMPFLSNSLFQQNFTDPEAMWHHYPSGSIVNPDNTLNETAFAEVGKPMLATSFALSYVVQNLGVTASITHVFLFYGRDIWKQFRASRKEDVATDAHMKAASQYKEVPAWWYYVIFIGGIALNIGLAYANNTALPWWGVLFAILLSSILALPLGAIQALAGTSFGLNILSELICGLILPGRPVANMLFKCLGFNTQYQSTLLMQDLKLGHYLRLPARHTFWAQIGGTVIGAIINWVVNESIITNPEIAPIIATGNGNGIWSGAGGPQTINSAAITWGAIGPLKMFGPGTQYYIFLWALFIGLFLPVPFWLLHRKFPKAGFNYVNTPLITIGYCNYFPGLASSFITSGIIISVVCQFWWKRYHRVSFTQYNYLLSAALDAGTATMAFILAFAVFGAGNGGTSYYIPDWWGSLLTSATQYPDHCTAL